MLKVFDVMFAALMTLCIVSSSRLYQVLQKKKREGSKQLNKENIIDDLPLCRIVCHEVDDRENDTKHSKVISCVFCYTHYSLGFLSTRIRRRRWKKGMQERDERTEDKVSHMKASVLVLHLPATSQLTDEKNVVCQGEDDDQSVRSSFRHFLDFPPDRLQSRLLLINK